MVAIVALVFSALAASVVAVPATPIQARQVASPWASLIPSTCSSQCSAYTTWASNCQTNPTSCAADICSSDYISSVKACLECAASAVGENLVDQATSALSAACTGLATDLASISGATASATGGSVAASATGASPASGASGSTTAPTSAASGSKAAGTSAGTAAPSATKPSGAGKTIATTWGFAGVAIVVGVLLL